MTDEPDEAPRDLSDLTVPEQLVLIVLFLSAWGLVLLLGEALGVGDVTRRPYLVGPVLGLVASGLASLYVASRPRWGGPAGLAQRPAVIRTSSRWTRVRAFWRRSGRRGLLVAAVGLFGVAAGLGNAAADKTLVHALLTRGVTTDARVARVSDGPRGGLDSVTVRFVVNGRPRNEDIAIIDTVPDDIAEQQPVRVVYDPSDPSQVLLVGQVNDGHIRGDYQVAVGGGVLAAAGVGWWLVRRRT